MEIVVGIFHGHSNIFFRVRQPYISEINNEVDLQAVSRITCAKYLA